MFLLKMLSANYRMRRRSVLRDRSVKPFQRRLWRYMNATAVLRMMSEPRSIPSNSGKTIQFVRYTVGETENSN